MEFKQRLRTLWCQSNEAERRLWQALQNPQQHPQLGELKFSRHAVVGDFFIDFVCTELKLAIELDSGSGVPSKAQQNVTTVLQYKGYLVVRLWQQAIKNDLSRVLDQLSVVFNQRRMSLNKQS